MSFAGTNVSLNADFIWNNILIEGRSGSLHSVFPFNKPNLFNFSKVLRGFHCISQVTVWCQSFREILNKEIFTLNSQHVGSNECIYNMNMKYISLVCNFHSLVGWRYAEEVTVLYVCPSISVMELDDQISSNSVWISCHWRLPQLIMFNFVKSVMWQVYKHNKAATLVPFIAMPSNDVKVIKMYSEVENVELLL